MRLSVSLRIASLALATLLWSVATSRAQFGPPRISSPGVISETAKPVEVPTPENPHPVTTSDQSKPLPNRDLGQARVASNAMLRRLSEELEDRLLDYVEEFNDQFKRVAFSDLERDDIIARFKDSQRDPLLVEQLETALIDLDPLGVQRACKKLEMPAAETESLLARVEVSGTFASLKKKIEDGDSALTVNRRVRKLQHDLKAIDLPQGKRLALLSMTELIVAGSRIRDTVDTHAMRSLPPGAMTSWPIGTVPIVFYPRIAKGQVFVLGSDCLIAGADPGSDVTFGQKTVAEALGWPVYLDTPPVPDAAADVVPQTGLTIRNPDDTGAKISYKILRLDVYNSNRASGNPAFSHAAVFSIAPGVPHRYPGTESYVVEFSRGPGRETARHSLKDGLYDFVAHPQIGWQLRPNTYEVTIDNSENPNDFHYVFNNRRVVAPARGSRKHTNNYPITIRFDRGGGSGLLAKVVDMPGTGRVWKVGINVESNYWDLYSLDEIPLVTN